MKALHERMSREGQDSVQKPAMVMKSNTALVDTLATVVMQNKKEPVDLSKLHKRSKNNSDLVMSCLLSVKKMNE